MAEADTPTSWFHCTACTCRDRQDVNDADGGVQFDDSETVNFAFERKSSPVRQKSPAVESMKSDFGSAKSTNSRRSETSSGRRRSQEGQMGSRGKYGSSPSINARALRSHNLRPQDIEMSQALKKSLGIADPNEDPTNGGSPETTPRSDPGFLSSLKKSFTSLGFSEPTSPTHAASPDPTASLGTGSKDGLKSMMMLSAMRLRLNAFRQNIATVAMPTEVEVDRGLQIEGVYDFYTFEDKKVRVRKMNADVYHERKKDDVDSEDESSETPRSSGGDDTSGSGDRSSSLSSGGSGSGSDAEKSSRRKERRSRKAGNRGSLQGMKATFSSGPVNPEASTNWGILVGKLMHMKTLDFTGLVDKAGHHIHKEKYKASSDAKGTILNSVRDRARLVARRAWEIAKRVSKEPVDRLDSDWDEKDLLVQLFSTEYFDTLALFANTARKILAVQPSLVSVSVPCRIFGDIHGQFRDLLLLFKAFGGPDERGAPMFVFNGDFVDRGAHQLEVIGLLLALKVLLPERVWLIRGNHEDRVMNKRYGFLEECKKKLGATNGTKIYDLIQNTFDVLPVSALIADRVMVVHGGVGDGNFKLGDIRQIRRPLMEAEMAAPWISNLLWSDPIEDDDKKLQDVFGVHASPRGGAAARFGWNITKQFCARNGLSLIVRSHQSKQHSPGFDIMHESLLMRVFSARDYEGHGNDGAVLLLQGPKRGDRDVLSLRPQVLRSFKKMQKEEKNRASVWQAENGGIAATQSINGREEKKAKRNTVRARRKSVS